MDKIQRFPRTIRRFPRTIVIGEVPLKTLTPGRKFELVMAASSCRRIPGEVIDIGICSARVVLGTKSTYASLETLVVPIGIPRFPRTKPRRFPRSIPAELLDCHDCRRGFHCRRCFCCMPQWKLRKKLNELGIRTKTNKFKEQHG